MIRANPMTYASACQRSMQRACCERRESLRGAARACTALSTSEVMPPSIVNEKSRCSTEEDAVTAQRRRLEALGVEKLKHGRGIEHSHSVVAVRRTAEAARSRQVSVRT